MLKTHLLRHRGTFLVPLILFLASCETGFDVTADYRDVTVVYGLLERNQPVQYIKINKAFLGEGNALLMAREPDSSNYEILTVRLEEWDAALSQTIRSIEFEKTVVTGKDSGTFYWPEQVIYRSKPFNFHSSSYYINPQTGDTLFDTTWLNPENIYRLTITEPGTGKIIRAETPLVHDFHISKPSGATVKFTDYPEKKTNFRWNRAENGIRYEFEISFRFMEKTVAGDSSERSLNLITGFTYLTAGDEYNYYYPDEAFFDACAKEIPLSSGMETQVARRYNPRVVFQVRIASEELSNYIDVNAPSGDLLQEKPLYTNIENGIGIFASRYMESVTKPLHNETSCDLRELGLKFDCETSDPLP